MINWDRAALVALFHATGGPNWERSRNWPTSPLMGDWEGVGTVLREDGVVTVTRLWLSENARAGPLPPEIGNLVEIRTLDLTRNQLTGPIPPEPGNLTKLERLSLSPNALIDPIPFEQGSLADLRSLLPGRQPAHRLDPARAGQPDEARITVALRK